MMNRMIRAVVHALTLSYMLSAGCPINISVFNTKGAQAGYFSTMGHIHGDSLASQ